MTAKVRVLIVDDDTRIATVLVQAFTDECYEARQVGDGRQALDLLEDWLPDVIVLDLMMPVMDGWTFRKEQLARPGPVAQIPVVVLTGAHEPALRTRGLGATAVIAKPFALDDLLDAVMRATTPDPKPPG